MCQKGIIASCFSYLIQLLRPQTTSLSIQCSTTTMEGRLIKIKYQKKTSGIDISAFHEHKFVRSALEGRLLKCFIMHVSNLSPCVVRLC